MGKYVFTIRTELKSYNVRQLVYEQHKILYYIDDAIHVIGFMHTKRDINKYITNLRNFIDD